MNMEGNDVTLMQDQIEGLEIPMPRADGDEPDAVGEDQGVLEEGYIFDYISNAPVKDTPKEKVRQRIARALFHEYGIAPSDMARDFPLKIRNEGGRARTKKADIAIFAHGTLHDEVNLRRVVVCKPEPKRGKNGTKLREPEQAQKDLEELKDLMGYEDRPDCLDGLWTDNVDFFFLRKIVTPFGAAEPEFRSDWAPASETVGSRTVVSHQRLRRAEPERLKTAFRRCHNYIHGNEGRSKDAAFWQFLFLLFAKMYDERISRRTGRAQFHVGMTERFDEAGRKAIGDRIKKLFEEVKGEYSALFKPTDEIDLSDRALAFIVSELAPYDLSATDVDAKGIAYQELVGTNLRGDRGQYFTPRGAVKLMVDILDPKDDETVLDPTCGTGGFLAATLNHLLNTWRRDEGTLGFPDTEEQQERFRDRLRTYAEKHLFGADFDPSLVRATTMNIMTLADTTANLYYMDSLAFPRGHLPGAEAARDRIPLYADTVPPHKWVDVLLTNPPFGSDIPVSDESVLGNFVDGVAKLWGRDEDGELVAKPNVKPSAMAPEQLFIQRAIEWVKPAGRIGIVLPNGILSNPGPTDEGIRRYILEQCWILASIELPVETFIVDADVNILTTLLFLKRKTDQEIRNYRMGSEKPYPVFMAVAEKVGRDRRNNEVYKREPNGEVIKETVIERERIRVGGADRVHELRRTVPVIDNDLPLIAEKYREFRKVHKIPGVDPRTSAGGRA